MSVMAKIAAEGFFIASFGIDGRMEGLGLWKDSDLSPKWTQICDDFLHAKGGNFEYTWNGALSHLRTKFTSAQGAALCTFFVHDQVASSVMLLGGINKSAEEEVSRLFVESLRRNAVAMGNAVSAGAFSEVLTLTERPLMTVMPIPLNTISEQDHELVRELSLHLAYSYLMNPK